MAAAFLASSSSSSDKDVGAEPAVLVKETSPEKKKTAWTDKGTHRHLSLLSASPQQTPWPLLLSNEAASHIHSKSILQLLLPFMSWEQ